MTEAKSKAGEAKDPEGVEAQSEAASQHVWVKGTIVEKHENLLVVRFPKKGGEHFTVTIDRPRWNCDPSEYSVGDVIGVKADFQPGTPDHVSIGGQGFSPAE